ncbi:MAG: hypothetical protein ACE5JX_15745 [Acidobacteriota bacterium]
MKREASFNWRDERGVIPGWIIGVILLILFVAVVAGYLWWASTYDEGGPEPCTTEANLFVGIDTEKPAPGDVVHICPGEPAGIAWNTVGAQSAAIEPELGEVALEGLAVVQPQSTTNFQLTAEGPSCSDSDAVAINVVQDGDTLTKTLNAPPVDRDTGIPVDLIWRGSVDAAFVSASLLVTRVELTDSCEWPKWEFRKTDPDGTEHSFNVDFGTVTELAPEFVVVGQWEATPVDVPAPVAIADCPVGILVTLRCE